MRNDRDNEVLNDSPRILPVGLPPNTNVPGLKSLQLQASSVIFKTNSGGAVVGSTSILLTANLRAIAGTPVFTVKSGTATLTSGSGPETRTLQFANMSTDYVVIEVSVEDTSTFKPTGNEPNTVYKDEIMIAKIADGSVGRDGADGQDGATGGTGPRTATGYLYYQYSRSTAPAKPSASSFNFSSGTFGSLTSNWSSTPPTFQAGNSNKYWYVYYAVRELSYGGSQAVTISNPSQGIGFSGLVTFSGTELTNGSSSFDYTQIDGGWIKTGTLDASQVNVTNLNADNITSGDITSAGISIPAQGGGYALYVGKEGTSNNLVEYRQLVGYNIGCNNSANPAQGAIYARTLSTGQAAAAGVFDASTNTSTSPYASVATSGRVADGARAFWSHRGGFYDAGGHGYNPFTGCHEGVVAASDLAEEGDILIDTLVLLTRGVSDAICLNEQSSVACDKRAIGVFHSRRTITEEVVIAAARVMEESQDWTGMMEEDITNDPALVAFRDDYRLVQFNAVGEGLINVCGQNGNIEIGDLIVTSDMQGKGMKQDDDIVRNYTVAKSREAVTFSSPDEVKQIACIYLCG